MDFLKMTLVTVELANFVILFLLKGEVRVLFGASAIVVEDIIHALPIFLLGFPFVGIARAISASFYATERVFFSYIVVYVEPFILAVIISILPHYFGQTAVWWSQVLAEALTGGIAAVLLWVSRHEERKAMHKR